MTMNKTKTILYSTLLGITMLTSSCSDFTDLQPKGKNLLETTDQLEMLLNAEFATLPCDEMVMCGDVVNASSNVPSQISQPVKTRNVIMWTWDADNQDKMAELTSTDSQYSEFYGYIGKICNPILTQIDAATGDEAKKKQLKCEVLTLRAYIHYLLVNKFAKAYNPSTAATDRGIIYMTEDKDISVPQEQSTVQEVYDNIIKDVNEAIELDGLPAVAVNRMRMSKPCAYAVKALALLSMQDWSGAEEAANQALALNGAVDDYNKLLTKTVTGMVTGGTYNVLFRQRLQCEEDLFYTHNIESMDGATPEAATHIEKGNLAYYGLTSGDMYFDYTMSYSNMVLGVTGYNITFDLDSGWNACGLKTTYMYLVVAEAELHNGNIDKAMEALDKIRVNRIKTDEYAPLKGRVTTEADAIKHIKETSSGEGIWSVYNFINRKRWNQISGWQETYKRTIGDATYSIAPDSPLWIFPLPLDALNNNPNLKQNYK